MSLYALFYFGSFVLFLLLSIIFLGAKEVNVKLRNILVLAYQVGMMLVAHAYQSNFSGIYSKLPNFHHGLLANLSYFKDVAVRAGSLWVGPLFIQHTWVPERNPS